MRTVQARAYEDESHPEGGRVVILLSDLKVAPLKCGFRIKQIDGTANPVAALGWPGGDLQPLESRATENGVELVLGPDVTRSDALTPGAAVEIEMPETGLRAEFLWPAIEVGQRRRRNVVIARPRRKPMMEHKADNDHAVSPTVAASATSASVPDRDTRGADIHPLPIKALAPIRDAVTPLSDNGTTTMSQSNSILSQLDALDALADLGAASVAQSDPVPAARSASAAPPAYMQPANDTVFALFTELKHDIELLKREQRMSAFRRKSSNSMAYSRICGTRSKPSRGSRLRINCLRMSSSSMVFWRNCAGTSLP